MHRRQVGERKSITKTALQGRRITLGYFSCSSESILLVTAILLEQLKKL